MRALVYTAVRTLELQDWPEPSAGPGEVKVRVGATGICGSDIHGFLGHSTRRLPGLILGHETLGEVVAGESALLGKRVSVNPLISCGNCHACRAGRHNCCVAWRLLGLDHTHGGFAEYVVVPTRNVHELSENVPDEAAVMVEPLANAFHLLSMIPPSAGLLPPVVILGAGTLGLCILAVAQARGLQVLAISEPNADRAAVARKLGAKMVLDPAKDDLADAVLSMTGGSGVPVALDAVGRAATRTTAVRIVERGGTALLLGLDEGPTSFDFFDIVRREVRLQTSFAYTESDFAQALAFVQSGLADFGPWTEVMPLAKGQEAFNLLTQSRGDRIKIALAP